MEVPLTEKQVVYDDLYIDTVYGPFVEKYRIIFIDDYIDFYMMKRVLLQFYKYVEEDNNSPIHVMINSQGGLLDAAFAFISEIELCDCHVITYNIGYAISAAAKIFLAGDLRIMYPYSSITLHSIRSGKYGVVNNFSNYAEYLKKYNIIIKDYLKRKTKLDDEAIKGILDYDNEFTCLAEEAIEYGLADQIYAGRIFIPPRSTSQYNYNYALVSKQCDDLINKRKDNKEQYREEVLNGRNKKIKKRDSKEKERV